jgi:DNA mismatch endonuclease (patch repair protein)
MLDFASMPKPVNRPVIPSSPHASATMKANRRRDTKPEVAIRSLLHRQGLRFRIDKPIRTDLGIVRPDLVFTTKRIAVFVDGCYWHACPEHGELPRANRAFWREKFKRNRARDKEQTAALENAGWAVLRIWEHEEPQRAAERVLDLLMTAQTGANRSRD